MQCSGMEQRSFACHQCLEGQAGATLSGPRVPTSRSFDYRRQALSRGLHLLAAEPAKAKNKTWASGLRRKHGRHSAYRDAFPGGTLNNFPVIQPVSEPEHEVHPLIAGLDPREIGG